MAYDDSRDQKRQDYEAQDNPWTLIHPAYTVGRAKQHSLDVKPGTMASSCILETLKPIVEMTKLTKPPSLEMGSAVHSETTHYTQIRGSR